METDDLTPAQVDLVRAAAYGVFLMPLYWNGPMEPEQLFAELNKDFDIRDEFYWGLAELFEWLELHGLLEIERDDDKEDDYHTKYSLPPGVIQALDSIVKDSEFFIGHRDADPYGDGVIDLDDV